MHLKAIRGLLISAAALSLAALVVPGAALAQAGSDQARGAAILRSLQQGQKSCGQLSGTDYELVGEAWMGQVLGSTQAHDAMNQLMASMMGSSGEEQMHQFMGRRATGCGGTAPGGFAAMMGRMGLMGSYQGGTGMMGGQSGNGGSYGYGGMMGGSPANRSGDDDNGLSAGAMVGMMAVPIIAIALALLIFKPWRRSGNALERLDRRFASGELSAEEYRERKKLLDGGGTR
jgi:hypothetical protein